AVVSVGVRPLGPSGTYTVNYRVTSADGHVVSGSWSFRLTVAGTGTPGPSASAMNPSNDGIPVWPFFVAAGLIVAGGAVWALRGRRCPVNGRWPEEPGSSRSPQWWRGRWPASRTRWR